MLQGMADEEGGRGSNVDLAEGTNWRTSALVSLERFHECYWGGHEPYRSGDLHGVTYANRLGRYGCHGSPCRGHMSAWDVRKVTSFRRAFYGAFCDFETCFEPQ